MFFVQLVSANNTLFKEIHALFCPEIQFYCDLSFNLLFSGAVAVLSLRVAADSPPHQSPGERQPEGIGQRNLGKAMLLQSTTQMLRCACAQNLPSNNFKSLSSSNNFKSLSCPSRFLSFFCLVSLLCLCFSVTCKV